MSEELRPEVIKRLNEKRVILPSEVRNKDFTHEEYIKICNILSRDTCHRVINGHGICVGCE